MTEKIQERAIEAAAKFVDRRGYEVLDRAWSAEEGISVDLVARDGDAIVFIDVAAREGIDKGLPEEDPSAAASVWRSRRRGGWRSMPRSSRTSPSGST